jgi:hypothetical protein
MLIIFGIGIFGSSPSAAEALLLYDVHHPMALFHLHFTIERSGYR